MEKKKNMSIGEVVGDLIVLLFIKGIFTSEDLKTVLGDETFAELVKKCQPEEEGEKK